MDEYKAIIKKMFDDLAEVDEDHETYQRALAYAYFQAQEHCDMEDVLPENYTDDDFV